MAEQEKKAENKKSAFEIAGMTETENLQLEKQKMDHNL
jgi:hypothetical protein